MEYLKNILFNKKYSISLLLIFIIVMIFIFIFPNWNAKEINDILAVENSTYIDKKEILLKVQDELIHDNELKNINKNNIDTIKKIIYDDILIYAKTVNSDGTHKVKTKKYDLDQFMGITNNKALKKTLEEMPYIKTDYQRSYDVMFLLNLQKNRVKVFNENINDIYNYYIEDITIYVEFKRIGNKYVINNIDTIDKYLLDNPYFQINYFEDMTSQEYKDYYGLESDFMCYINS